MDQRISRTLQRQHGVVTRAQMAAMGVPTAVFDGHVRRGRLVVQEWGVHRSADVELDAKGLAMAAVLRAGFRGAVTGPLVLRWLGVDSVPNDAGFGVLLPSDVARPRLRLAVPVWRTSSPFRTVVVDGIPCTIPARSVLESVRVLGPVAWLGLVDQCDWRGRPTRRQVRTELGELVPGGLVARRARAWLAKADAGEESPGERWMFAALPEDVARTFLRQQWVTPNIRVDGLDPATGVVLEYLGRDHHHAGNRPLDAARDDAIRAAGFEPLYVTSADLDHPGALAARVARATERRR